MLRARPVMKWIAALLAIGTTGCASKAPYEGKSVAQLEAMLRDDDPARQVQGAFGLSRLGDKALPALPALMHALKNGKVVVRENSALALGKLGPAGKDSVPALTEALDDSEWTVRRQAALALAQIGPDARSAKERLERLAEDQNKRVADAAREALKRIQR